ncbi:MAG: hypothetical protein HQL13_08865, partial [Candidatus Omnitrophica bacterium]|nr:hypothetical protein [Candidatus Omnitrophota bacterium]
MKKFISIFIAICIFVTGQVGELPVYAQVVSDLPAPGTMVNLSPAFEPVLMKGLKVHPENPFLFDFIMDAGNASESSLQDESNKLIKYFLAALTVPDKDLWVNLSPYEKNRMIADNLSHTVMGRDMLAQDYVLKQLTASLIYPEKRLGKKFWDEVYTKSRQLYGTTQIPVDTFNKVWIVADRADVFERGNVAYVVGAHLKVMLEEDYLALSKRNYTHSLASDIIRKIILPQIEQEVNRDKNFASLRQMFYSMILASWYKTALKNAILAQIYGDQSKVKVGINQADPKANEAIFKRYLQAYKKGVFNYIKEDFDQVSRQPLSRKYFSGGEKIWGQIDHAQTVSSLPDGLKLPEKVFMATTDLLYVPVDQSLLSGTIKAPESIIGLKLIKNSSKLPLVLKRIKNSFYINDIRLRGISSEERARGVWEALSQRLEKRKANGLTERGFPFGVSQLLAEEIQRINGIPPKIRNFDKRLGALIIPAAVEAYIYQMRKWLDSDTRHQNSNDILFLERPD